MVTNSLDNTTYTHKQEKKRTRTKWNKTKKTPRITLHNKLAQRRQIAIRAEEKAKYNSIGRNDEVRQRKSEEQQQQQQKNVQ